MIIKIINNDDNDVDADGCYGDDDYADTSDESIDAMTL
jgi:hypothetical protein